LWCASCCCSSCRASSHIPGREVYIERGRKELAD
jgi:hypothetical protein